MSLDHFQDLASATDFQGLLTELVQTYAPVRKMPMVSQSINGLPEGNWWTGSNDDDIMNCYEKEVANPVKPTDQCKAISALCYVYYDESCAVTTIYLTGREVIILLIGAIIALLTALVAAAVIGWAAYCSTNLYI